MNIGDEYCCRYVKNGKIEILVSPVKEILDNRKYAVLKNGKQINIVTGRQRNSERYWMPFDAKDEVIVKQRLASRARKWFRKVMSVDEIMVDMYRKLVKTSGIDTRAYFHRLRPDTIEAMKTMDIAFLKDNFRQPDWCFHQNALEGCLGCRKLILGAVKKPSNCYFCRYYIAPDVSPYRRLRLIAGISVQICNKLLSISDYEQLETGERPATQRERNILSEMFNINKWTLEQVSVYFRTKGAYSKRSDPVYMKFHEELDKHINISRLFNEKNKIKY